MNHINLKGLCECLLHQLHRCVVLWVLCTAQLINPGLEILYPWKIHGSDGISEKPKFMKVEPRAWNIWIFIEVGIIFILTWYFCQRYTYLQKQSNSYKGAYWMCITPKTPTLSGLGQSKYQQKAEFHREFTQLNTVIHRTLIY